MVYPCQLPPTFPSPFLQDDFSPFRRQAPDEVTGEMSADNLFDRSSSSMMLYNRASSSRPFGATGRGRRASSVAPVSSLIHWQVGAGGG